MPLCTIQHKKNQALLVTICHPTLDTGHGYLCLNYCSALLVGLVSISVCLVLDHPKSVHATLLLIDLHWLPMATKF